MTSSYLLLLASSVAGIAVLLTIVRFFAQENKRVAHLLALFAPGTVVQAGEHSYRVIDESCGFVHLRAVDGTHKLRLLDLMTPAGTYRRDLLSVWSRRENPVTVVSS